MDPALLREREAFKKRALAQPAVESKKRKLDTSKDKSRKQKQIPKSVPVKDSSNFNYKTASGSSQYKFGVLAKIVKHMKTRHQQGDTYALTIDEILDETNQLDIGHKQKQWLISEALLNNPKIDVVDGFKYKFKPKHNVRDRKGLLRLLDKHDQRGWGGILLDDIEESLPHSHKCIKALGDNIIKINRSDKKEVLFYNDKSYQMLIDDEFQKMWRRVSVEGIDERKIEEYLEKQGIQSMQDLGFKKVIPTKRKKGNRKKTFKKHNDHLDGVLNDYNPDMKK